MLTLNLATAALLESVVNRLVALDIDATEKMKPLIGKRIAIRLTDWGLTYIFDISADKIRIDTQSETPCQVTLTGTSFAFFNMANTERGGDAVFKGEVLFEGEVSTAQAFQKFWMSLEVDWEEELSRYTGDLVAHQLGRTARHFTQQFKRLLSTAEQNLSEYAKEEFRMTPDPIEVESFYQDLDDLRGDVDRLEHRIQQLQRTLKP
jgi:ubiquinone biosynthesis protein UbiJ